MLHVSESKGSDLVFKLKTYSALVIPLARTNYFPEKARCFIEEVKRLSIVAMQSRSSAEGSFQSTVSFVHR